MTVIKYAKLPCPRIILAAESKIPWNEQAEINHSKDVPINSGVLQGMAWHCDALLQTINSTQYFDQVYLCAP